MCGRIQSEYYTLKRKNYIHLRTSFAGIDFAHVAMVHFTTRMGHRYAACAFAFRSKNDAPHPAEQDTTCRWRRPRTAKRPRRNSTCQNMSRKHRNGGCVNLTPRENTSGHGWLHRNKARGGILRKIEVFFRTRGESRKITLGEFHRRCTNQRDAFDIRAWLYFHPQKTPFGILQYLILT